MKNRQCVRVKCRESVLLTILPSRITDTEFEERCTTYYKLDHDQQIASYRRTQWRTVILLVALLPGFYCLKTREQKNWSHVIVTTLGFQNLYQQHSKIKQILEAAAKTRARMNKVIISLDKQPVQEDGTSYATSADNMT